MAGMTDIVERLRHHARVGDGWTRPDAAEAADEIERLRAECQRLAGEVSRAHKDALTWMERAAAARREGIEAAANAVRELEPHLSALKARDYPDDMLILLDDAERAIRALLEDGR